MNQENRQPKRIKKSPEQKKPDYKNQLMQVLASIGNIDLEIYLYEQQKKALLKDAETLRNAVVASGEK